MEDRSSRLGDPGRYRLNQILNSRHNEDFMRLVTIGVISVVGGFLSAATTVGVFGIAVLKPINYTFYIAIVVGVMTALTGFRVWARPGSKSEVHG